MNYELRIPIAIGRNNEVPRGHFECHTINELSIFPSLNFSSL